MIPRVKNPSYIFFGVSSFQALAMFRRGLFYMYLSIYIKFVLGLSVTETTFMAAFPMVLNIFFQTFVWGRLSDRRQIRRTLILIGEFTAGIGTIIVWFLHTQTENLYAAGYIIIIGFAIVEIFWSMSNVGWSALISDLYTSKKRLKIQGRLTSIGAVGRIFGIWIGGYLYDGFGLEYAGWGFQKGPLFFTAAGMMFISMIPMLFMPEGGVSKEDANKKNESSKGSRSSPVYFATFLVGLLFINMGRYSVSLIQSQYLSLESGFAVSSICLSYILNTETVSTIAIGLIIGWIGARLGNGKTLCMGAALAALSLFMYVGARELWLIYLSGFIRGASEVIILSSSYAFASVLIPPEKRARFFSIYNATFFLSWGLGGTLITGPIIDTLVSSGSADEYAYRMAFLAATVITFIGLVIQSILVFGVISKTVTKGKHV